MIQPDEFLHAAREQLGDARVDKIVTINDLAAQRLKAYEEAMTQSADNTEITRQPAASGALTVPQWNNDTTAAGAEAPSTTTAQPTSSSVIDTA